MRMVSGTLLICCTRSSTFMLANSVLCTALFTDVLEQESQKFGIRAVVDKSNAGTQLVGVVEEVLNNKV